MDGRQSTIGRDREQRDMPGGNTIRPDIWRRVKGVGVVWSGATENGAAKKAGREGRIV